MAREVLNANGVFVVFWSSLVCRCFSGFGSWVVATVIVEVSGAKTTMHLLRMVVGTQWYNLSSKIINFKLHRCTVIYVRATVVQMANAPVLPGHAKILRQCPTAKVLLAVLRRETTTTQEQWVATQSFNPVSEDFAIVLVLAVLHPWPSMFFAATNHLHAKKCVKKNVPMVRHVFIYQMLVMPVYWQL